MLEFVLTSCYINLVPAVTAAVNLCGNGPVISSKSFTAETHSDSYNLCSLFSAVILIPEPCREKAWYKCTISIRAIHSLLFSTSRPGWILCELSAVIKWILKMKLFWLELRDVRVYGYKGKDLERSLIQCSFSRINSARFSCQSRDWHCFRLLAQLAAPSVSSVLWRGLCISH